MCARVLRAGFEVSAYDLRPEAVERRRRGRCHAGRLGRGLRRDRRRAGDHAPDAGRSRVRAPRFGGALDALPDGALAIDMSTSSPELGRRIAEAGAARGIGFLDAPVADALKARTATCTSSSAAITADVARARPVLETMGRP